MTFASENRFFLDYVQFRSSLEALRPSSCMEVASKSKRNRRRRMAATGENMAKPPQYVNILPILRERHANIQDQYLQSLKILNRNQSIYIERRDPYYSCKRPYLCVCLSAVFRFRLSSRPLSRGLCSSQPQPMRVHAPIPMSAPARGWPPDRCRRKTPHTHASAPSKHPS